MAITEATLARALARTSGLLVLWHPRIYDGLRVEWQSGSNLGVLVRYPILLVVVSVPYASYVMCLSLYWPRTYSLLPVVTLLEVRGCEQWRFTTIHSFSLSCHFSPFAFRVTAKILRYRHLRELFFFYSAVCIKTYIVYV